MKDITVCRSEPNDYEAVQKIFTNPRVIWGTLQLPYPSVDMWKKRLAEPPEGLISLVACVENNEVVGQLGLHTSPKRFRRRHAGQIGMADNWLDLRRLELEVYVDNIPAIRLYEKFGFIIEGTLVEYAFRDGEYVDTYLMARLRNQNG